MGGRPPPRAPDSEVNQVRPAGPASANVSRPSAPRRQPRHGHLDQPRRRGRSAVPQSRQRPSAAPDLASRRFCLDRTPQPTRQNSLRIFGRGLRFARSLQDPALQRLRRPRRTSLRASCKADGTPTCHFDDCGPTSLGSCRPSADCSASRCPSRLRRNPPRRRRRPDGVRRDVSAPWQARAAEFRRSWTTKLRRPGQPATASRRRSTRRLLLRS